MTSRRSAKLLPYAMTAGALVVAALALRRAELAACATPFALFLALGLLGRPPELRAWLETDEERVVVGDQIPARLVVRSARPAARVELMPVLPHSLSADQAVPIGVGLGADDERIVAVSLSARRFGATRPGEVAVRARDRYGLRVWEGRHGTGRPLYVYPAAEALRRLVAPREARAALGSEPQPRRRGDGLEFADTRPYVPGDRLRTVNWRATARFGELVVDVRTPERNADVLLFVDSFAEIHDGTSGTLELAVRAATSLAEAYLSRRDRVGLVGFGGILRWLEPGGGPVQRYRIVEAMLETRVDFSYAWKGVDSIPARALRAGALVIAITPLVDERSVAALLDLRRRGHDLAVIEIDPDPLLGDPATPDERSARRLWGLRRQALRLAFQRVGVAVLPFGPGTPLAETLEGVRSFRRHGHALR